MKIENINKTTSKKNHQIKQHKKQTILP